ncbi:MAG: hypothetical protein RI885_553 [Actinomycetota bacterium]|jgi:aryl-alcohol dehydrogenase-like predicted oxidoreductase
MRYRRIGDVTVSAIGLGGMPLSTPGRPDREQAIATIHAALDAGVTLIDTADAYTSAADGQGHNEVLIAEALQGRSEEVLIATKGGHVYGRGEWSVNGSPEHLARSARDSLTRLGGDAIGLYQFHRPDPAVPFEESMGAIRTLLDEGIIRMAGVSNTSIEQIRVADDILGGRLVSVQNQFSPVFLSSAAEMDYCAEHEIAFLPWSPLGGASRAADVGVGGTGSDGARSAAIAAVAAELEVSPQRVVLAWELALQHTVIPIPGARREASIRDSALAADLVLDASQLERLSA